MLKKISTHFDARIELQKFFFMLSVLPLFETLHL